MRCQRDCEGRADLTQWARMRNFLSESNLRKAVPLAVILTLMTVGRLVQGGRPLGVYLPMTFLVLLFMAGAVTAWGQRAGMAGIVTDRRTFALGATIAAGLSLMALPLSLFWLDPILKPALQAATQPSTFILTYPPTVGGCLALLLWSAGFQTLFLQAAPMSLFARLTNRRAVAVGLCVALRIYVTHLQAAGAGMTTGVGLLVASAAVATSAGCLVFARFGLVPAMLLAAGLDGHVVVAAGG